MSASCRLSVLLHHMQPVGAASPGCDGEPLTVDGLTQTEFTDAQRRQFVRDGFIIVRNAVPHEAVQRASNLIMGQLSKPGHVESRLLMPPGLTTHDSVVGGLYRDTKLPTLLHNEMGPHPDVISSQIAFKPPGVDSIKAKPMPHVDGSWSGDIPLKAEAIDSATGRPKDAARYFGPADDRRGLNDGQLWMNRERTLSMGSYTCLVGVALNDQRERAAHGQLGVLRGMHGKVEECFRRQRDAGLVGPEGLGWPRIKTTPGGTPYCNGLHDAVRAEGYTGRVDPAAPWPWPEVTPVRLGPGDAVIVLHSIPHCPTPNLGPSTRQNVYFRIRRTREASPHEGKRAIGHGVSDHPDITYFGKQLDYPKGYDPFQTSMDFLCNHWSEWGERMQRVAREHNSTS